jgi:hypothetical protein
MRYSFVLLLLWCFPSVFLFAQDPLRLAKISDPQLQEISGIIPSTYHEGMFWLHNDSGDKAQIYLIDSLGKLRHICYLEGITFVDAEDIARFDIDGRPHLLVADMGNNLRTRDTLSLYIFEEPILDLNVPGIHIPAEKIRRLKVKYPDRARDTEAVFVDPKDHTIYTVTKRDFRSQVFSLAWTEVEEEPQLFRQEAELPFNFVTAADISSDGAHILIKNLVKIFYWRRYADEKIGDVLRRPGKDIPYKIEPQGEAICFDRDNNAIFYTISERPLGLDSYLYRYVID